MESKKYAALSKQEKYNVYILHCIAVNQQIRKCVGCIYVSMDGYPSCHYIIRTGHMRPCPPGEGCTVKRVRSAQHDKEDEEWTKRF